MFDKKRDTRWGSGEAQNPEMFISIEFSKPSLVSGIEYDLGSFPHDYPRGFEIEIHGENGKVKTVLKNDDYDALRYYVADTGLFSTRWKPRKAKKLILKQSKSDPVFDWSIAELRVVK